MNNTAYETVYNELFNLLSDENKDLDKKVNSVLTKLSLDTSSVREAERLIIEHIKELIIWKDTDKEDCYAHIHSFAKEKIKDGTAFSIKSWNPILRKAYFEAELGSNKIVNKVFETVNIYITHFNRFEIIIEKNKLLDFCILLIALNRADTSKHQDLTVSLMKKTLEAINFFKLKKDIDYKITFEGIEYINSTLKDLQVKLEKRISDVSGNIVLEYLFFDMKKNFFIKSTKRYDFVKYKYDCQIKKVTPVPYKYLINLCLKHLNFNNYKSYDFYKNEIEKIIEYSKNILNLIQCYDINYYSDLVINDITELPTLILHQNQFDVMCQPVQYYPDFVNDLIEKLLKPEINRKELSQINQPLKMKQFSNIFKELLSLQNNKLIDKNIIKKISKKLSISYNNLISFLDLFSLEKNEVNKDFTEVFEPINAFSKPLIKISNENYYLLCPLFCSFSFFQYFFEILNKSYKDFSGNLGNIVEQFMYDLLEEKNYSYKRGHYKMGKNIKGECDLVLEDQNNIVFVEIKRKEQINEFEQIDDKKILEQMGIKNGLFYASFQVIKANSIIQKINKIDLFEKNDWKKKLSSINLDDRKVYSIAIGFSEYLFFNLKLTPKYITSSLFSGEYHSADHNDDTIKELIKLANKAKELAKKINDSEIIKNSLNNVSFKSLQQIWYSLRKSKNISDFIEEITQNCKVINNLDVYTNIEDFYNKKQ